MICPALIALLVLPQSPVSNNTKQSQAKIGTRDELTRIGKWGQIGVGRKATVASRKGLLRLSLSHVPKDWPYEYQWGGVGREMSVDVRKFPILTAKVSELRGYAHMDIDVLDAKGKPVKSIRSSGLQGAGTTSADLSTILDPAIYRVRVRLIVGGPNEGCYATYDWVRFTAPTASN